MNARMRSALGWALVACLALASGCTKEPERRKPTHDKDRAKTALRTPRAPIKKPEKVTEKIEAIKEPTPTAVPAVTLTDELAATCLVKVGDRLPDVDLPDTTGKTQSLNKLFGSKLTVVMTWGIDSEYAQEALEDLDADVAKPYSEKGVKIVGIDLRDSVDKVREMVQKAHAAFPILLDADGKYFAKLAKDKPLRTYLIDAQGQILWFDVEYSRSTRRELLQAIEAVLAKP